jgi:hypothetical protein
VRPAPQEAADADRAEPLAITSPECRDQNVIWRSSLSKIGNDLSTGARTLLITSSQVKTSSLEIRLRKTHPGRT